MFQRLVDEIDPSVVVSHAVIERVLAGAVETGSVTGAMQLETETAIHALVDEGATVVVCTCSTIGGVAEATKTRGAHVMRVDRPMAEQAVASGRRIVVAATLASTLRPTIALIRQIAEHVDRDAEIVEVRCADAWAHFERGDHAAYAHEIARAVWAGARVSDIVVLAQASMAAAAPLIRGHGIPVLSSPELGVRAALHMYHRDEGEPADRLPPG